ncbi:hypothetical protein ACIQTU_14345 [Brevundimonas sp. NPDC090276]|uniref:ATP-binding protein n=1 Tax=Brevundimonas sp. NPDC090276 TaxID=3363956 RepID=UPI00383B2214
MRVLLVGDARMAFPVAKALDQAGHRVFAGVSTSSNYLEWSRHVSGSFRHSPLEPGTDEALPVILDWLDRSPVDVIQPVSEAGSRFMTRHRAAFEARGRLIMPEAATVETCMNKTTMFELCETLGVALAPYRRVRDMEGLFAAAEAIGYPLIVKPAVVDAELFERKALIIADRAQLSAAMPHWPDIHPELIVQQYLTGPRHSVIFSADRGRLLGAVEIKAARTHEYDGTGYTTYGVTVEPTPLVREGVEKLVAHLAYSSTGCAQFIVCPTSGAVTFMEVNPRVSLGRISECAGLPHSLWGLQLATDETVSAPDDPWAVYRRGVRYVWTKGDLNLLIKQVKRRQASPGESVRRLTQIGLDAVQCTHAIFDPLDPLPALGTYSNILIKRWRRHPEYQPGWTPVSVARAPEPVRSDPDWTRSPARG